MRAKKIVDLLLNHKITKQEAINLIIERNQLNVGVDFEITGSAFTSKNDHSILTLQKNYSHKEVSKIFKSGDKVKLIRTN